MARYSKGIAALLGSLTPTVLIGLLAAFGVHLDVALAGAIVTIVVTLATILAPANKEVAKPFM